MATLPPQDDPVVFWVDGSCIGNPGPCGVGVVRIDRGVRTELSRPVNGRTNNVAELAAVALALRSVDDTSRPVVVHTDSRYAVDMLTRDWTARANAEVVDSIRRLMKTFRSVRLVWVKGHAGLLENEAANRLAQAAARGAQDTRHGQDPSTMGNQGVEAVRPTGHTAGGG